MTGTRIVRSVRIHVPVAAATLRSLLAGEAGALESDATLATMLAIVREQSALGDFGLYHGVAEITLGWETFVPGPEASPTLGSEAETTFSPTVTLTTWIREGADEADVDTALDALMAAHPWEVPVIEIAESRLLLRS